MVVPVGPHEVGQQLGIRLVRLCSRDTVPLPVTAHRQRVDGVDLIPGADERAHQQTSVGLDPDRHLSRLGVVGDQRMDAPHALDPFWDPRLLEPVAFAVEKADIVMLLGPVNSQKDHRYPPASLMDEVSLEELSNNLMDKCSSGTTSHQCSGLLTDRRGHGLGVGLDAQFPRVLTHQRLPDDFSPPEEVMQPPPRTPPPSTTTR